MELRLDRCVIEVAVRVLGRLHLDILGTVLSARGVLARQRFPRLLHVEVAAELNA